MDAERLKAILEGLATHLVDNDEAMGMLAEIQAGYTPPVVEEVTNEWEEKYNELKQKYIARFFGGEADGVPETTQSEPETVVVDDENEVKTIDELFEED